MTRSLERSLTSRPQFVVGVTETPPPLTLPNPIHEIRVHGVAGALAASTGNALSALTASVDAQPFPSLDPADSYEVILSKIGDGYANAAVVFSGLGDDISNLDDPYGRRSIFAFGFADLAMHMSSVASILQAGIPIDSLPFRELAEAQLTVATNLEVLAAENGAYAPTIKRLKALSGNMEEAGDLIDAGLGASSSRIVTSIGGSDDQCKRCLRFVEVVNPTVIPEPSTMVLLGTGLIALVFVGRRKIQRRK